ncbi:MAG: DUF1772 domain-containing protein [Caldilineaceae bacterium]|nr:DUF1772 domain-containing protein [Caldilineaceae bacterium]
MFADTFFPVALVVATFLASLVAGLLFVFAIVVMPGIKRLPDREFIRAFQAMDGIIQNNQPLFVLVWVGSVVAVIASALLGLSRLEGPAQVLILLAAFAYVVGVQVPTVAVNVPLNNRLQAVNVDALDPATQQRARLDFEPRWNRWNAVRTVVASLAAAGFMLLLLLL